MGVILLQQLSNVGLGRDVAARDARDGLARTKSEEIVGGLLARAGHSQWRERRRDAATDV
jgi:hypothetical protein